jgi:hypothetical protein
LNLPLGIAWLSSNLAWVLSFAGVSDGIFSFTCSLLPKEFHLMPVASFPSPFSFI